MDRQGLWVDEVFSLAMATGHSLEHPAAIADAALGDYLEHPAPRTASEYAAYLEHDKPAVGAARVIRAVFLSDTSPPLYYLLLYQWTRLTGTGDTALRLFSVLWALACLPLLWSLGRQLGGRTTPWIACWLFAMAPVAIRYSTEGRMYSLLWFAVLLTGWTAVQLRKRGASPPLVLLLVVGAAAGLLTHYFYLFAFAPIAFWLSWFPGRCDRRVLILAMGGIAALVAPWYLHLPESLEGWRVTQEWIYSGSSRYRAHRAPFELAWSYFSSSPWESQLWLRQRHVLFMTVVGCLLLWRLDWHRRGQGYVLLLLWLGGACLGPLILDLVRGTYTSAISRYALAGLPAAFLLLASGLSRIPRRGQAVVGLGFLVIWLPGIHDLYTFPSRGRSPVREVALAVAARDSDDHDLVLIQSIPSGVLGVARYLDGSTRVASWVGPLEQRQVPQDVDALTHGSRRVFLVKIRANDPVGSLLDYLKANARILSEADVLSAEIVEFAPLTSDHFGSGEKTTCPAALPLVDGRPYPRAPGAHWYPMTTE